MLVTISRELAWQKFERTVRREFPGHGNRGLRAEIRRIVLGGGSVGLLGRRIAFTVCGSASLDEVCRAANAWQEIALHEDPLFFDGEARP